MFWNTTLFIFFLYLSFNLKKYIFNTTSSNKRNISLIAFYIFFSITIAYLLNTLVGIYAITDGLIESRHHQVVTQNTYDDFSTTESITLDEDLCSSYCIGSKVKDTIEIYFANVPDKQGHQQIKYKSDNDIFFISKSPLEGRVIGIDNAITLENKILYPLVTLEDDEVYAKLVTLKINGKTLEYNIESSVKLNNIDVEKAILRWESHGLGFESEQYTFDFISNEMNVYLAIPADTYIKIVTIPTNETQQSNSYYAKYNSIPVSNLNILHFEFFIDNADRLYVQYLYSPSFLHDEYNSIMARAGGVSVFDLNSIVSDRITLLDTFINFGDIYSSPYVRNYNCNNSCYFYIHDTQYNPVKIINHKPITIPVSSSLWSTVMFYNEETNQLDSFIKWDN